MRIGRCTVCSRVTEEEKTSSAWRVEKGFVSSAMEDERKLAGQEGRKDIGGEGTEKQEFLMWSGREEVGSEMRTWKVTILG